MNFNCIPDGTEHRRGLKPAPSAQEIDRANEQRAAAFAAASESMSEGIKRCGSVQAWMDEAHAEALTKPAYRRLPSGRW